MRVAFMSGRVSCSVQQAGQDVGNGGQKLGQNLFFARDLLHEVDDASTQLRVGDSHERFGQRETVRRGEKIRHVGRRRRLGHSVRPLIGTRRGHAFKEERHRDLQDL